MLDLLTPQHFEPLLHQRFTLCVDEKTSFAVELIEVRALPRRGDVPARAPFSLTFRGPREYFVPQRVYTLENETLGKHDIFLVPIGPDEVGHRYEAIFN